MRFSGEDRAGSQAGLKRLETARKGEIAWFLMVVRECGRSESSCSGWGLHGLNFCWHQRRENLGFLISLPDLGQTGKRRGVVELEICQ